MQSRLAAGELRQRIKIEEPTESQGNAGQVTRTWDTLSGASSLPARVEAVSGGESLRGRQVSAETRLVLTVRYRSDITTTMRVVYAGGTYGIIRASDPYGDQIELRIECKDRD